MFKRQFVKYINLNTKFYKCFRFYFSHSASKVGQNMFFKPLALSKLVFCEIREVQKGFTWKNSTSKIKLYVAIIKIVS